MRRSVYTLFLLLAGLFATAPSAMAAPERQIIDVAHSTLDFKVSSMLIDTEGTFKDWQGEVLLDRANMENSSVKVTIQAASIDTRITKRDNHLTSPDFLDAAQYPIIGFESTRVEKTGDSTFKLIGDFTLHGVTKSITIPVTIDRLQDEYSRFRGQVTLSRSAYGVSYNSKLNPIADEVVVTMVINIKRP